MPLHGSCGRVATVALALTFGAPNGFVFLVAPGAAVMLSACANTTAKPVTASQIQLDAQLIADSVTAVVVDLSVTPGVKITPAQMAAIQAAITTVKNDASAIVAATNPSAVSVANLQIAVQALVPLIQPYYAAAPQVGATATAMLDLVNVIMAQVQSGAVTPTPTPPPASPAAVSARMQTTESDRAVLRAAAMRASAH